MLILALITSLITPLASHATNGYFAHGYGTKNKALAGGGSALPQDAMIAATNPAGIVWTGDRMDLGAALFSPQRQYTVTGDSSPDVAPFFDLAVENVESDSNYFLIPHFAHNWMLDIDSSVGLIVYGNGGMNTDYPGTAGFGQGTYFGASAGGEASAGVDLSQLFINATYARKLSNTSSWGVSAITAYQRFKTTGLAAFGPFSSDDTKLTDNGYDYSLGFGAKLGWQGEVSPSLTLAAAYQTKIAMGEFKEYAGLFAEQGGFDIPATWTLGLAYDVAAAGTITFDVQTIYYNDVKSIANSFLPNLQTSQLGNNDGAGFGYEDMTIYKLGYQWPTNPNWTWRVGYSIGEQPVPSSEVVFNILAPAVMEQHFTGGFTLNTSANSEFNLAAMYAPSSSVTGPNPLSGVTPDQNVKIEMSQWELEASWAWKY
jgi:long-chain fatty acid transport protein